MKLALASIVALLLLFAPQSPASAASAQALVQKQTFSQAQPLVEKARWRRGWGHRRGHRHRHLGYYGGFYPPVYGYYFRSYPYGGYRWGGLGHRWGGLGWGGGRHWHHHW